MRHTLSALFVLSPSLASCLIRFPLSRPAHSPSASPRPRFPRCHVFTFPRARAPARPPAQVEAIIQDLDPLKPQDEVREYMNRGLGQPVFSHNQAVDLERFYRNLKMGGIVVRARACLIGIPNM